MNLSEPHIDHDKMTIIAMQQCTDSHKNAMHLYNVPHLPQNNGWLYSWSGNLHNLDEQVEQHTPMRKNKLKYPKKDKPRILYAISL